MSRPPSPGPSARSRPLAHEDGEARTEQDEATTTTATPTTPKRRAPVEDPVTPLMKPWPKNLSASLDTAAEDDPLDGSTTDHNSDPASETGSTPLRPRVVSAACTRESVGDELQDDLNNYMSRGISVSDFLKLSFKLSEEDYKAAFEKVKGLEATASTKYKEKVRALSTAIRGVSSSSSGKKLRDERAMYDPLVEIGNMFLEEVEEKSPQGPGKVRLHNLKDTVLKGTRGTVKPDIVLIPKSVQDRVTEAAKTKGQVKGKGKGKKASKSEAEPRGWVDVREVLAVCEVKPGGARVTVKRQNHCVEPDAAEMQSSSSSATIETRESSRSVQASTVTVNSKEQSQQQQRSAGASVRSSARIKSQSAGSTRSRSGASTGSNKRRRSNQTKTRDYTPGSGLAAVVSHTSAGLEKINAKARQAKSESAKKSADTTLGNAQLATYATEMLSARGDRLFAFGIRVNADKITLSLNHRSALIEAQAFTLEDYPEYFALFLLMFQRDPSTYGFNSNIGYYDPFNLRNEDSRKMRAELKQTGDRKLDFSELKIGGRISSDYCLVGRGSAVLEAKMPGLEEDLVVKVCWQPGTRQEEAGYIMAAGKVLPENIAIMYGYAELDDDTPLEELREKCTSRGKYEKKKFRIIVMKWYESISNVTNPDEFWELMVQCAECLHILYKEISLLHRDISIGNLAFYRDKIDKKKVIVVILDFDLAAYTYSEGHRTERRTGTAPFMAREVLDGFKEQYTHGVHHDLESIFYVLVWHAVGYRGNKTPENGTDPLEAWRKGSYAEIRAAKDRFIANGKEIIAKYIEHGSTESRARFLLREYAKRTLDAIIETGQQRKYNLVADEDILEVLRLEAIEKGLPEAEIHDMLNKKTNELEMAARLRRPTCAISFKRWMKAACRKIDDKHLGCDCCGDD